MRNIRPRMARWGSNSIASPMAVAPESGKVAAALSREDLFTVVLEHFLTDTADYADYVLPATTQLEHLDVHTTTATPTR